MPDFRPHHAAERTVLAVLYFEDKTPRAANEIFTVEAQTQCTFRGQKCELHGQSRGDFGGPGPFDVTIPPPNVPR